MRNLLLLFLLLPLVSTAQTPKYALLGEKDKLIGEWEWVPSDTGAPAAPIADLDWRIIKFTAGANSSMAAIGFEEARGYTCPTYFMAFSNGGTVMGTISDSCSSSDKGKKFSFDYTFEGTNLVISLHGEKFYYKRRS